MQAPLRHDPRLMFVPVSGPYGMGEYARSLAIARAVRGKWAAAAVHFILSREAPYAAAAPFPSTLLSSSATFHTAAVIERLDEFRPDVVIFDNAGRTAQLRAARRLGARIVFISARGRQRSRAFRWGWMRLIDEHWIAYPRFVAGAPRCGERLKLALLRRPVLRYLDVMLPAPDAALSDAMLKRLGCEAGRYVLVVPGGGTGHPGTRNVNDKFLAAARALAADGVPVVFVGPSAPAQEGGDPNLRRVSFLPQPELAQLMRSARLILANGGSTLLQGIACARPCIAVPIARDQAGRSRRCAQAGVALTAPLDAARMLLAAKELLADEPARTALAARAGALALVDGIELAVQAIDGLIGPVHA